jgi:hypothetical protein
MKSLKDELTQRYLLLLKLDAKNLLNRVKERRKEFVEVFAMRRTREHFTWLFSNRYEKTTIRDLAHCSTETIQALDQFYTLIDEMKWYLYHTEDMPNTVEDNIFRMSKRLEKLHATLELYLDAELSIDSGNEQNEIASQLNDSTGYELSQAGINDIFSPQEDGFQEFLDEGKNNE